MPCDQSGALRVWGLRGAASLCASLSAEQPGSMPGWRRAGGESASVLAVLIVCEQSWCAVLSEGRAAGCQESN